MASETRIWMEDSTPAIIFVSGMCLEVTAKISLSLIVWSHHLSGFCQKGILPSWWYGNNWKKKFSLFGGLTW